LPGERVKILFLTTVLPGARTMGSEVASQALIDAMCAQGAEVLTVGYRRAGAGASQLPNEIAIDARAIETRNAGLTALWWFAGAVARELPYSAAKYRSTAYIARVRELLAHDDVDAVVVDHAQMAWVLDALPQRVRVIAVVHNIEHEMYRAFSDEPSRRSWSRWAYRREARLIEAEEGRLSRRADEVWAFTEHDAAFFSKLCPKRVRIMALPGGSNAPEAPLPKSCDVALIGNWSWRANRDALEWFLEKVYPQLPQQISIQVAGKDAQWVTSYGPNLVHCGFVPSAQAFLAQARVIAIPTQSGGGIQIKTLDAIASGSRIVATPIALRGIDDVPATVTVADGAEAFAQSIAAAVHAEQDEVQSTEAGRWSLQRRRNFEATMAAALWASRPLRWSTFTSAGAQRVMPTRP